MVYVIANLRLSKGMGLVPFSHDTSAMARDKIQIPTLDLFSGIGGFSFALSDICQTIAYCEKDAAALAVLRRQIQKGRLNQAPIFTDVFKLQASQLPADPLMITAGFPCQDVTSANVSGRGLLGIRSKLISQVYRLIDECPSVHMVFLENSPFITTRGLKSLVKALASRSFIAYWGIFSANEVGAPHLRKRWFCLAVKQNASLPPLQVKWKLPAWKHPAGMPRVLPRTTRAYKDIVVRGHLLGNSIVPLCAAKAFETLWRCASQPRQQGKPGCMSIHSSIFEGFTLYATRQIKVGKRVNITMESSVGRFHKPLWATPVASVWRQCKLEGARSTKLLSNQIFYERETIKYIHSQSKQPIVPEHVSKNWVVNPKFVEWLMGYPTGYTEIK